MKLKPVLKFPLCVLAGFLIICESVAAQDNPVTRTRTTLANMRLENVQIERESLGQLFAALSFAYNIPLGLEVARSGDRLSLYQIDLEKGTLSELLTQFVAQHEEYIWKIENGVVSVFPKDEYRDPVVRELLLTEISSYAVKGGMDAVGFGRYLLSTPEAKRIIERQGMKFETGYLGGFYIQQLGRKFSFEVSGFQVKSILDKVVKESPVARIWIMQNNTSGHEMSLRVYAQFEDVSPDESTPK